MPNGLSYFLIPRNLPFIRTTPQPPDTPPTASGQKYTHVRASGPIIMLGGMGAGRLGSDDGVEPLHGRVVAWRGAGVREELGYRRRDDPAELVDADPVALAAVVEAGVLLEDSEVDVEFVAPLG